MTAFEKVDREITSVYAEMHRREPILLSETGWYHAWNRHPDLSRRINELYAERGAIMDRPAVDPIRAALEAVIAATQAYLPPDGIDAQECINRILTATDNPEIVAALAA